MKRLLSIMIVIALMLSAAGIATASSFDDVEGTEYEGAVSTLTALGLITGFPDGTYRPDDTVTRAQFAAISVRALGLDELEQYSRGATKFPDVPATHWASGYINIASDQGIISGYTDGTFRPENPVTVVEVLAMLIRVLGYEPVVTGSWPTNYLVKAFELGISKGITFSANEPATRGLVALFLNNVLEIELMERDMVGSVETYKVVEGTSILRTKLGFEPVVGRIMATANVLVPVLDEDEVILEVDDDEDTYTLAAGLDASDYLGYLIRAYEKDGVIVRYQVLSQTVVSGILEDIEFAGPPLGVQEITPPDLIVDGDSYSLAIDGDLYYNLVRNPEIDPGSLIGSEVDLFFNSDNEVVFVNAIKYEDSVIVTSLDERYSRIIGHDGFNERDGVSYDFVINKDGSYVEFDALQAGDVFHFFVIEGYLYMLVVSEQVTGSIAEAYVDNTVVVVVGDEEYTSAANASLSSDLGAAFADVTEDAMIGYVGADVVLYLDRDGLVRHIVGDVEEPVVVPDQYVIVVTEPYSWDGPDGTQYFVRVRDDQGTITRYEFNDDTEWTYDGEPTAPMDDVYAGDVLKIATDEDLLTTAEMLIFCPEDIELLVTNIHKSVTAAVIDDATYKLDDVVIFTITLDGESVTTGVADLDDLLNASVGDGFPVAIYDSEDLFLSVMLVEASSLVIDEDPVENIGVITRRYITADGARFEILVDGEKYDCFLPEGGSTYSVGDFVGFECVDGTLTGIDLPENLYDELCTEVQYVNCVVSYNEGTRVLRIADSPEEGAETKDLLVDPDVIIYDCTGAPVMGDEDLLVLDTEVKLVVVGNIVTHIKVIH